MLSGSGTISIQRTDQKDFKKATISISSSCGIPLGSSLHDIAQKINKIDYRLDQLSIYFARPETEGKGWTLSVSDGSNTIELILTDESDIHNVLLHLRNKDIQAFLNLFGTDIKNETADDIKKMIDDYLKVLPDSIPKRSTSAPARLSHGELSPMLAQAATGLDAQPRQEPRPTLADSLRTNFEFFSPQQTTSSNQPIIEPDNMDSDEKPITNHHSVTSFFRFRRPRSPEAVCLPSLTENSTQASAASNTRK